MGVSERPMARRAAKNNIVLGPYNNCCLYLYLRKTMKNEHAEQEMAHGMQNGARSKVRARSERFDGPGSDC